MLKKDLRETLERADMSTLNITNTQPSKATLENAIKAVLAEEKVKMGDGSDAISSII
jgi:hypothetical protein